MFPPAPLGRPRAVSCCQAHKRGLLRSLHVRPSGGRAAAAGETPALRSLVRSGDARTSRRCFSPDARSGRASNSRVRGLLPQDRVRVASAARSGPIVRVLCCVSRLELRPASQRNIRADIRPSLEDRLPVPATNRNGSAKGSPSAPPYGRLRVPVQGRWGGGSDPIRRPASTAHPSSHAPLPPCGRTSPVSLRVLIRVLIRVVTVLLRTWDTLPACLRRR